MKVKDVMSKTLYTCGMNTTLETAAMIMWDNDCGCVPIIDDQGMPLAIVTDRDIAIGSALQHKPLWDLRVADITGGHELFTCKMNDDIGAAMQLMQTKEVRRLPVVNNEGKLHGMISMGDILAQANATKGAELPLNETLSMLQKVTGHHKELQAA